MVVTTSVLVAIFLLLGIGLIWLAMQRGAQLWPAPTPTPTAGPTRTPTPDKRATFVAEDMLTQAAFTATAGVIFTPDEIPPPVNQPQPPEQPALDETPQPQENGATIALLPIIMASDPNLLPPAPSPSPTNASIFVPSVSGAPVTATPDPFIPTTIPTATPVPGGTQPTATPTIPPPTPTYTPWPTFTPAPLTLSEMPATIRVSSAPVHIGPSAVYTQITTLNQGAQIRLRGRTAPGDWVYACCLADLSSFWIRPAYINVDNTLLPTAVPTTSDPKSLRWLALQPADPALTPRPIPTSIAFGDFPLARYDAANTGRVPTLPSTGLTKLWPLQADGNQSGSAFSSPMVVLGTATVILYNSDGNIYSLFWDGGNQRWKYAIQPEVRFAPALAGNFIYAINGSTVSVLEDRGGATGVVGQVNLPNTPQTPINIWLNMLLVGAGDNNDARLLALRRDNLNDQRVFETPSGAIQMPAIGQETIYVGADRLYAIDANLFDKPDIETIWTAPPDVGAITIPPIYAYPGVRALAELYVASGNLVHALDANTGAVLWTYNFGIPATSMAVNETGVVVVGNGQMHKISRELGTQLWPASVSATVMGGPLVSDRMILLVTQAGAILLYDGATGALVDASQSVPAGVVGGPAVSNGRIFLASGNTVYAYQGNP